MLTCGPARRMHAATVNWRPHIARWESEHESHPTAVDARHRPHRRDAILCTVRVTLFAEFRVSVIRRSSVSATRVRLARLWGSKRPHKEPHAIPAWAPSRLTSDPRARPECCRRRAITSFCVALRPQPNNTAASLQPLIDFRLAFEALDVAKLSAGIVSLDLPLAFGDALIFEFDSWFAHATVIAAFDRRKPTWWRPLGSLDRPQPPPELDLLNEPPGAHLRLLRHKYPVETSHRLR